ncbi:MAG TPA: LURP-one-related family protein, partial [Tepidisphaeraceae bacterium]|nr:LURP-one-related family protein [Tepidisphaeraceae bacterium]
MRYVMKQKLWAWGDDFTIKDESGADRFFVDGKALSFGDKLSLQDMGHNELAYIQQKVFSWGPTYEIYRSGQLYATVKEKLWTFMKYRFVVDQENIPGPVDLEIEGDFW